VIIEFLRPTIGADMAAVDHVMRDALNSDVVLIRQVAEHIVTGGGKRLRPALLLLTAGATGYQGSR
jgi:octaprenyl-diphosphate synthase